MMSEEAISVPLGQAPQVYFIADATFGLPRLIYLVEAVLDGGAQLIQFRCKQAAEREIIKVAQDLRKLTKKYEAKLLINDSPSLCEKVGARGVHLGWDDASPAEARAQLGSEAIIGLSIHTKEQARQADYSNVNYVSIGPVFPSKTKPQSNYLGVEGLVALMDVVQSYAQIPIFCIGGINIDNAAQLTGLRLHGIVVGAALGYAANPTTAYGRLLTAIS